jgi:hypothetical protein
MKTHRIVGMLWMILCGVPSIYFLLFLLQVYHSIPRVIFTLDFDLAVLFCLLALAGAVAAFPLYRGAVWARRFVGVDGVLIMLGALTWFVTFQSLPSSVVSFSVLAIISLVLLFLPRHEPVA